MALNYTASQIASLLANCAERVCQHLLPGGRVERGEYVCADLSGGQGKSLKVRIKGKDKLGVWTDFADSHPGGDLLTLWEQVRGINCFTAMHEAADFLGISLSESNMLMPRKKTYRDGVKRPRITLARSQQPGFEYLRQRGLSEETIKAFMVTEYPATETTSIFGVDIPGNEATIAFPYIHIVDGQRKLLNNKYLALQRTTDGKKHLRLDAGAKSVLFGWQAHDVLRNTLPVHSPLRRSICLTEGEIDAMSLWQLGFPALSMPTGAQSFDNWLEHEYDHLMQFDNIYLVFDTDEAGQASVRQLAERLGEDRVQNVILPYKDVNDGLLAGMTTEDMRQHLLAAKHFTPDDLRFAGDYYDDLVEFFHGDTKKRLGLRPPWKMAEDYLRFAPGRVTIWSGYNHAGKSVIVNHVLVDAIHQDDDVKVCIASMEVDEVNTLSQMYRQISCLKKPAAGYIRKISDELEQRILLFIQEGNHNTTTMMKRFEYAHKRYGFNMFVVDSLVQCGVREDDYDGQRRVVQQFVDFVRKYKVHLHLITHLRKGSNDDRVAFRIPDKEDIRGAAAISDLVHNVCIVARNSPKEDAISHYNNNPDAYEGDSKEARDSVKRYEYFLKQPDTFLRLAKTRDIGARKIFHLWFNTDSLQFHDSPNGKVRYIQFAAEPSDMGMNVVALDSVRQPTFVDDEEVI